MHFMDNFSYISGLPAFDRRDDTIGNVRKRVFKQMVLANEGMRTEARNFAVLQWEDEMSRVWPK